MLKPVDAPAGVRNLKVPSKRNLLALVIELDLDAELMADFCF